MSRHRIEPERVRRLDLRVSNAFLVDDRGTLTLVDAGLPWDAADIVAGVEAAGRAVEEIDRVLVTHFDVDHVGGLAVLSDLGGLDAPVYIGGADAPLLEGQNPDWRTEKGFVQLLGNSFFTPPDLPVEAVTDGDRVGSFTVYHTPGHTPGHVAYVSEDRSCGFLGDLVVARGGEFALPPRFLTMDAVRARASVRSLVRRAPAFEVGAVGHGTPFASGASAALERFARSLGDGDADEARGVRR